MPTHRDVEDQSDSKKNGENRRAAVRNERQGHTADRQETHHHPEIDDDLPEQDGRDAHGSNGAEAVTSVLRYSDAPQDQEKEQSEQQERTDKTMFFAKNGEGEVRMLEREKAVLILGALHEPLAKETACEIKTWKKI